MLLASVIPYLLVTTATVPPPLAQAQHHGARR
jgi:hypothetical protein